MNWNDLRYHQSLVPIWMTSEFKIEDERVLMEMVVRGRMFQPYIWASLVIFVPHAHCATVFPCVFPVLPDVSFVGRLIVWHDSTGQELAISGDAMGALVRNSQQTQTRAADCQAIVMGFVLKELVT